MITSREMYDIVRNQLAIDYNCLPMDFERNDIIFTKAFKDLGRREMPFGYPRCEIITMGKSMIVNATDDVLPFLKKNFSKKTKCEILNSPFIYGVNPYYLPNIENINGITINNKFTYKIIEHEQIYDFYKFDSLNNALQYNKNSLRPEIIGIAAFDNKSFVGISCASKDSEKMWQIGVDILSDYRNNGIATTIVNMLTREILNRGIVPYYTTDSSNIASQRTAISSGYIPAWSHCFRHRLKGGKLSFLNHILY